MGEKEYMVRGARLKCSKGSHTNRINLPRSHGLYTCDRPQIIVSDCTDKNISYFGICNSFTPPKNSENIEIMKNDKKIGGRKCCPDIIEKWQNVHGNAVTTDSYLICNCGGCIEPVTSGQEFSDSYQGGGL